MRQINPSLIYKIYVFGTLRDRECRNVLLTFKKISAKYTDSEIYTGKKEHSQRLQMPGNVLIAFAEDKSLEIICRDEGNGVFEFLLGAIKVLEARYLKPSKKRDIIDGKIQLEEDVYFHI